MPFTQIVDQRNAAPVIIPASTGHISAGTHVPGLDAIGELEIPASVAPVAEADYQDADDLWAEGFGGGRQMFKIVFFGEKSSLADVLAPVEQRYGADVFLPSGEPSDSMLYHLAASTAADGRPLVAVYFSDADPSGWQMPISVARKRYPAAGCPGRCRRSGHGIATPSCAAASCIGKGHVGLVPACGIRQIALIAAMAAAMTVLLRLLGPGRARKSACSGRAASAALCRGCRVGRCDARPGVPRVLAL